MVVSKVRLSNKQLEYLKKYAPMWHKKITNAESILNIQSSESTDHGYVELADYNHCVFGELDSWSDRYMTCSECGEIGRQIYKTRSLTGFGKVLTKLLVHDRKHRSKGERD